METDEYCVEKVSFYQLNLLRLDVAMTLIYTQYLAPFLTVALFVNFKIDILVFLSGQGKTEFAVDENGFYGSTFDFFQN